MAKQGIIYIAYGEKALVQVEQAVRDQPEPRMYASHIIGEDPNMTNGNFERDGRKYWQAARWAKVNLYDLTPFEHTLYADADTRIIGDIAAGFLALEAGFDIAITPSNNQGREFLWHVDEFEREVTRNEVGFTPVQLQAGVFFFRKSPAVETFFRFWRREWLRFEGQDQGAFTRALRLSGVRLWLLGKPWNGGAVIQHIWGACR